MLLFATALTFHSCGGEDEEPNKTKLSQTSYSMYHEDTQEVVGTDISDLEWDSENEFVATVEDNVIKGQYVGQTEVKSTTKNLTFTVEVKARHHLYEEPLLNWGASKSSIKAKYGTPVSETQDGLIFETADSDAPLMIYMFENGKMISCGVACKISAASELSDFLLERYFPVDVDPDDYSATLVHCYGKKSDPQIDYVVGMQYNSSIGAILVMYVPNKGSKSRSIEAADFDTVFKILEGTTL